MTPLPPNPWMSLNEFLPPLAGNAAPAEILAPNPAAGAAAYPAQGYECCLDCGYCEPCDSHCPHTMKTDLPIDEAAFMAEVEPVPAFISRPLAERADEIEQLLELARAEEWPAPPQRRTA